MANLLSLPDAARQLGGISAWTLRKHISLGKIEVTRLGRRVFLKSEEVERIRREGLPPLRNTGRKSHPPVRVMAPTPNIPENVGQRYICG
jgi:hypothetical protein